MPEGLIVVLRKWKKQMRGMGYIWNQEKWVVGWNIFVRTVSTKTPKSVLQLVGTGPIIPQTSFEHTQSQAPCQSLGVQAKVTAETSAAQRETEHPSKCFTYVKWFNPYHNPSEVDTIFNASLLVELKHKEVNNFPKVTELVWAELRCQPSPSSNSMNKAYDF